MNNITENFRLPRYKEIPDIGLYLEQTVSYINNVLSIIDISITSSMLSNYVKKGMLPILSGKNIILTRYLTLYLL